MKNSLAKVFSDSHCDKSETLNEVRTLLPGAQLLHIFLLHSSGSQRLHSMSMVLAELLEPRRLP